MSRIAVVLLICSWVIPMSVLVNHILPEPYMDEIFHIPQAQKYCNGNFWSWDPMITTPPGLYFLSLAHVVCLFPIVFLLQLVSSFSETCSVVVLRSLNGLLAVMCSLVVFEIVIHLRPTLDARKAVVIAFISMLYPLQFFFSFLYYTDVASVTAVLAMYLLSLKKKHHCSALVGALSVLIRQTNIIWVLFVTSIGIMDTLIDQKRYLQVDDGSTNPAKKNAWFSHKHHITVSSTMRQRHSHGVLDSINHSANAMTESPSASSSSRFVYKIRAILLTSRHIKWQLFLSFGPFLAVLMSFFAFISWNGSVVLGAKEAHVVSLHFAQVVYFGLFSAMAMAPVHFSSGQCAALVSWFRRNTYLGFCQCLLALILCFISVRFFSIAHPYLLADNRHYPFYIWRKGINAHWVMKYALTPFYVYSWFSIFNILGKAQNRIWMLLFFGAVGAVLVPAPLIEFRYFTVPFLFLILHSPIDERNLLLMGLAYVLINCFTMFLFLFCPFRWSHEPGNQRFMW